MNIPSLAFRGSRPVRKPRGDFRRQCIGYVFGNRRSNNIRQQQQQTTTTTATIIITSATATNATATKTTTTNTTSTALPTTIFCVDYYYCYRYQCCSVYDLVLFVSSSKVAQRFGGESDRGQNTSVVGRTGWCEGGAIPKVIEFSNMGPHASTSTTAIHASTIGQLEAPLIQASYYTLLRIGGKNGCRSSKYQLSCHVVNVGMMLCRPPPENTQPEVQLACLCPLRLLAGIPHPRFKGARNLYFQCREHPPANVHPR